MKNRDLARLTRAVRKDLKYHYVSWSVAVALSAFMSWLHFRRTLTYINGLAEWEFPPDPTPELMAISAVPLIIPVIVHAMLLMLSMIVCAFCILRLVVPRTETKLLLRLAESRLAEGEGKNTEANSAADTPPARD